MAVRLRKLAKELRRDPAELLGILHALGFARFRSPHDMLSDPIVGQLRGALRDGVAPEPVIWVGEAPVEPTNAPVVKPDQGFTDRELSSDLAGWVAVSEEDEGTVGVAVEVDGLLADLRAEHADLQCRHDALESDLTEARRVLEETSSGANENPSESLLLLLKRRGILGLEEQRRALESMLNSRNEQQWLEELRVSNVASFVAILDERLVLVDGGSAFAERLGMVVVSVPPNRAERGSDESWLRAVEAISDSFLVFGLRRVLIVGGPVVPVQFLRENIDNRLQVQWLAPKNRTVELAEADVHRHDIVILWGVEVDDQAQALYDSSKCEVLFATSSSLEALSETIRVGLE